ncbi:hypothetical protein MRX96_011036 [Rhipicephalus microplus]
MAALSSNGMVISPRKLYGRSGKNKDTMVKDIIAHMPSCGVSDFGDLTDEDEYIANNAARLATDDTDISYQYSEENEDDVTSSQCSTGSVDRGDCRKRLIDCCLPTFTDTSTQPAEVLPFLSYFREFVTPSTMSEVVRETNSYSTQTTGKSLNITESVAAVGNVTEVDRAGTTLNLEGKIDLTGDGYSSLKDFTPNFSRNGTSCLSAFACRSSCKYVNELHSLQN